MLSLIFSCCASDAGLKQRKWGESTKEMIRNTFTQLQTKADGKTTLTVTDTLRDRLICYVIVLALHLTAFEVPHTALVALCEQLKLGEAKYGPLPSPFGSSFSLSADTSCSSLV